jgi:hypothetical protein
VGVQLRGREHHGKGIKRWLEHHRVVAESPTGRHHGGLGP